MPDKPTISALATFISKHASFDCGADDKCPKCGHVLLYGPQWFDHKWPLASAIAKHLGLGHRMAGEIQETLGDCSGTSAMTRGDMCLEAANLIWERLYA